MMQSGRELILINLDGGPHPGSHQLNADWPPPETLLGGMMGHYVLQNMSKLPDSIAENPDVIREATYRFVEQNRN